MAVPIFSAEGLLGAFLSADLKLLFGQNFSPLAFGSGYFFWQSCYPFNILVNFFRDSF
jgi:hypothetical protein